MSDHRDDPPDDPKEQLKQGLGLLFRAARGAASTLKKEVDRSDIGKSIDDAGREFARAASNVVGRLASELNSLAGQSHPQQHHAPPEYEPEMRRPDFDDAEEDDEEDDEFDGVKVREKPKGPTADDPGFRIALHDDDDDDKSRE